MRVLCLTEIHLRRSNPSHFKEISQDNLREERWYVEIRNFFIERIKMMKIIMLIDLIIIIIKKGLNLVDDTA